MSLVIHRSATKFQQTLDRNQNFVERACNARDKGVRDGYSLRANESSGDLMNKLAIGDVVITSIIERDGPWRKPEDMFPAYDAEVARRHLAELDREVFDPASGKMVITYQTYIVRTPKHTILVDTCTGEDKGYPPP